MSLQMIDIHHGNTKRAGKALGERHTYKKRPHEPRATSKGHCGELFLSDTCLLERLIYHRDDILFMST